MTSDPIDIDALIERLLADDDARLRRLAALLTQEFLALPFRVEQLAAIVAEHDERLTRLEQVVQRLTEAVSKLRDSVAELRASFAEPRQTVKEMAEETAEFIRRLTEWQVSAEHWRRITRSMPTPTSVWSFRGSLR